MAYIRFVFDLDSNFITEKPSFVFPLIELVLFEGHGSGPA